jgi:hypothetical protein
MKKLIIFLFIISAHLANAQDLNVFTSNHPINEGVLVRWIGKDIRYTEGTTIFRRKNGGEWVSLTPSPIFPPKQVPNAGEFNEDEVALYDGYINDSYEEFEAGFTSIFTLVNSVKNYQFALAINLAYHDKDAQKGKKYEYKVVAKNQGKTFKGVSAPIKVTDYSTLPAPEEFVVTRKKQKSTLKWKTEDQVHYAYYVYTKKQADTTWTLLLNEMSSNSINNKDKAFAELPTHKDSIYLFKIKAMDYFGLFTEESEVFELETKDLSLPTVPRINITSKSKEMTNLISWSTTGETDISHYNLYRLFDNNLDTVYVKINNTSISPNDTIYTDNLSVAGTYLYKLEVVDNAGNKSISYAQLSEIVDIAPPPIPQNFSVKADTGVMRFYWDASATTEQVTYRIMQSIADEDNSDNKYVPVSGYLDSNYYEMGMAKNVRSSFVYRVCAMDVELNISLPSNEALAQLPDVIPPNTPFITKSHEENNALVITWMPNVDSDLKGYNLFSRKKGDTTGFEQVNINLIPKSNNAYIDKEIKRGSYNEYYLKAVDHSDLTSEASNSILAKLEFLPLSGNIDITQEKHLKNKNEFLIEWNLDSLVNEPIIGTAVFKSFNNGKAFPVGEVENKTRIKDKIDKIGTYSYHIRAYGTRGTVIKSKIISIQISTLK